MRPKVTLVVVFLLALTAALFFLRAPSNPPTPSAPIVAQNQENPSNPKQVEPTPVEPSTPADAVQPLTTPAPQPVPGPFLELKVIAQGTQEPLSGATIRSATSSRPIASPSDKNFITSADGIARIPLPETNSASFVLQIDHEGFAGYRSAWETGKGEKIPAHHTVALEKTSLIGGYVINSSGKPVERANVRIGRVWRGGETMDRSNQRQEIRNFTARTDAAGKWTAQNVPEPLLAHIRIVVSHPDYAELNKSIEADLVPELLAQTWVATLVEGERVTGFIFDTNKVPIASAKVSFGMRYSSARKETESDVNGRYELKNLLPDRIARENQVVVLADGFTPASNSLTNKTPQGELNFFLEPGAIIRGRVQDRDGQPIKDVRVSRERDSVMDDDGIVWSATTDVEGRFEWNGAPARPQKFYFGAAGYAQLRNRSLAPGPTEHIIILDATRSLTGTVRHAVTKAPIPRFFVMPASGTPKQLSSYASSDEREFKDGAFELPLTEAEHTVVRIRAPGFLTENFAIPAQGPLDAALAPSKTLSGLVLNSAGVPVIRAEVAALSTDRRSYAMLGKGSFATGRINADNTTTDEHGRFNLDLSGDAQTIVAVHREGGFAEMFVSDFERKNELRLQPWGRLEGVLLSYGKPLADQQLALHNLRGNGSGFNTDLGTFKATTDQQGRFTFETVPPRELTLSRMIPIDDRTSSFGDKTNITVTPGGVTYFEFLIP